MSIPRRSNRLPENPTFQLRTFSASISDSLCIPLIAVANVLNTFTEANDTLLSEAELKRLARALSILSRSSIDFIDRHREQRRRRNILDNYAARTSPSRPEE